MVTWTVVTVMGNIIWADTLNFQCYFCVIIQGAIEMALNNNKDIRPQNGNNKKYRRAMK